MSFQKSHFRILSTLPQLLPFSRLQIVRDEPPDSPRIVVDVELSLADRSDDHSSSFSSAASSFDASAEPPSGGYRPFLERSVIVIDPISHRANLPLVVCNDTYVQFLSIRITLCKTYGDRLSSTTSLCRILVSNSSSPRERRRPRRRVVSEARRRKETTLDSARRSEDHERPSLATDFVDEAVHAP
jgi:hypothetical protein